MVWQKRNKFKASEMNEPKKRLNKFQTIGSKVLSFECNPECEKGAHFSDCLFIMTKK